MVAPVPGHGRAEVRWHLENNLSARVARLLTFESRPLGRFFFVPSERTTALWQVSGGLAPHKLAHSGTT
jgi:hypothetical protein